MGSTNFDDLGIINSNQRGEKCKRIVKLFLVVLMVVILVGGIAILGIGIWTHEVEYGSKQLAGLIGIPLYQIDSVMMIACGTATIILICLGLFGILLPQKCLLGLHLSIFTFVAFGLFAAGILGYVFAGELEDTVRGSLKESVVEKYGVPGEDALTTAWNRVQQTFHCCGAYGNENSTTSWHLYHIESFWVTDSLNHNKYVPDSCCDNSKNLDACTGLSGSVDSWPPLHAPPIINYPTNYTLYTVGCFDKLQDYLHQNGILIGTAAVVVAVFMLLEIIMTIFFYRTLK